MAYHLFREQWLAARKPHVCIWCYQRIERGDVYRRENSVSDGHHQNFAWHWDCWFDAQENYFCDGEAEFTPGMDRPPMLPHRSMEAA